MSGERCLLIAEDDGRLAKTLELAFQDEGYRVLLANSLARVRALPLETLTHALIDLRLGGESGLQVLKLVKDHSATCRVVVMTGYGSIATAVEAVRLGAINYLTKPVSQLELVTAFQDAGSEAPSLARSCDQRCETLAAHERSYIEAVLLDCKGNLSKAARRLGLHRQSLQRKLRKYS